MKHTKSARIAITTAALALTITLAACNESDGGGAETPLASPSTGETESPSGSPGEASKAESPATSGSEPGSDVLTLDEPAEASPEGPSWSFPVNVEGWELGTFDQAGANQLVKDDGQAMFTTYQLRTERSGSDSEDGRAYLELYLTQFEAQGGVTSMTEPNWSTTTLPGLPEDIEFVQQDYEYTTAQGTYRSRYLARPIGDYLLAVQYAEPSDSWSEEEWQKLIDGGLRAMR